MSEIVYAGENLLAGSIGRVLIYLSFVFGFAALLLYILINRNKHGNSQLLKYARIAFTAQTAAIVGVCVTLFYLIVSHSFEYAYVYKHSSALMPSKYIVSSFWAGQEGSFLLWAFFIGTFGIGAMLTARKLEAPAMGIIVLAQLLLMSMELGFQVFGISLGSDPFLLLRNVPSNAGLEFFRNPGYLSMVTDGNGLNPLLENPWMVIHPPLLFMGYATAIFPFAYAFASLVQKDLRNWFKPTLPWLSLSVGLLGIGLIMGGAWAYQSLTFGGFWAWDPVENASLVPWLVQVAALHYMLLTYKRDKYYFGTYVFTFLGFIMVLYASYLTRSGVLGETSVHAFGDDGRSFQLILFMLIYILLPAYMLFKQRKNIPSNELPALFTREFLMMYGSIVLLLSAFQVISTTSIPVINKVFGSNMAPPNETTAFYNNWQMPFAMVAALLLGLGQYISYGKNDVKKFFRKIAYPAALSVLVLIAGIIFDPQLKVAHMIFLFCIAFTIFTSLAFLLSITGTRTNASAAITHVGFGIFLLGVLITFANAEVISRSESAMPGNGDNVMLFKDKITQVGDYYVCYSNSREERDETFFQIDFLEKRADQQMYLDFSLYPTVKYNSRMGNVHNPDTWNMLKGDVFMFLTFAPDRSKMLPDGYSLSGISDITEGDSITAGTATVYFDSLYVNKMSDDGQEIKITAIMKSADNAGVMQKYPLTYEVNGGFAQSGTIALKDKNVRLSFENISDKPRAIKLGIFEKQSAFVVAKIMFFPFIWVVWAGTIIMFSGITVSVWRRAVKAYRVKKETA